MVEEARRGVVAVVSAVVLAFVGAGLAVVSGDAIGLRTTYAGAPVSPGARTVAGILLVLALAWQLIGMLSSRTSLVRRPGAAGARAAWLAGTRPWRARESSLGLFPLDRWLLVLVPAGLLVATRAVETSLASWTYLAIVLGAWLVFAVVLRFAVGGRSPWPVIAAVGGAIVYRCILTLVVVAFGGSSGAWWAFWTDPVGRVVYTALALALFAWTFLAAGWSLTETLGRSRALGATLAAVGAALAVPAAVIALVGVERVRAALRGQFGEFGVSASLEIPDAAAWLAFAVGAAVVAVGVALSRRAVAASGADSHRITAS